MTKKYPSQEYLKECFDYDEASGEFKWNKRPLSHFKSTTAMKIFNSKFAGKVAGCDFKTSDGKTYRVVRIGKSLLYMHRVAIIMSFGNISILDEVDHSDGNGLNNSISNLRTVSRNENMRNTKIRSDNTSGVVGVIWDKRYSKWQVRIHFDGRAIHIGYFSSFDSAVKARKDAEVQYGYHKNHGTERPL